MKPVTGCFVERIFQFAWGRKSYRVDQNVQLTTKSIVCPGESSIELLVALNVTWKDRGIRNFGSKIAHVLLHAILKGKCEASAFSCKSLGNGPTDRTMVGNTKNKRIFSF